MKLKKTVKCQLETKPTEIMKNEIKTNGEKKGYWRKKSLDICFEEIDQL